MGNQNRGCSLGLENGLHLCPKHLTELGIQSTKWFIKQDQCWLFCKGSCQRYSLSLTTRELVWLSIGKLLHAGELQQLLNSSMLLGFVITQKSKLDVASNCEVWEEC